VPDATLAGHVRVVTSLHLGAYLLTGAHVELPYSVSDVDEHVELCRAGQECRDRVDLPCPQPRNMCLHLAPVDADECRAANQFGG
jgi:hypothetical protein